MKTMRKFLVLLAMVSTSGLGIAQSVTQLVNSMNVSNPAQEGTVADAFRHCIGACTPNWNPSPCPRSACVRWLLQGRESDSGLGHAMNQFSNSSGFDTQSDCISGCLAPSEWRG